MTSSGVVREFDPDQGWGVLDGRDVPGGCWVHFSAIAISGHRQLTAGQQVFFRAETATQDGFSYRAVKVWTADVEPPDPPPSQGSPAAYHSTLILTFDDPLARPEGLAAAGPRGDRQVDAGD